MPSTPSGLHQKLTGSNDLTDIHYVPYRTEKLPVIARLGESDTSALPRMRISRLYML